MLFRKFNLVAILLLTAKLLFAQSAHIAGSVVDNVSRDALPGAYIIVKNTMIKKVADERGLFDISGLSAGEYDVIIENVGYAPITKHVVLTGAQTVRIVVGLSLQNKAMEEVTVFGRSDREKESGSRNRERNAANMINVISAQAMVRSPDINAANVLQRMSGITVQRSSGGDEAYAVIRGMAPRYNNTLLNGIKIASPDEKNRFVQLDIIPSDILSSIEISKSLTPDMEGDAIGGTVNMVVKDAPDAASFKATTSIGYSQLFFDEKFIDFKKGDIQKYSPIQRNPKGYVAQPGDFSRSNLDFQPKHAPPTGTLGFSYTQRFLHNKIGVVVADNVQNQYFGNVSSRFTVAPVSPNSDALRYNDVTVFKGYSQQLNNGLVAHIDYVFNERNKINVDNFYVYSYLAQSRISEDTTLTGTGRVGPGTGQINPANRSFTQYQHIENIKLSGQHVLSSKLLFNWAGVLSEAGRRTPDLATVLTDYRIQSNYQRTGTFFDEITRSWLNNNDKDYTGLLNAEYHRKAFGGDLQLKAGGLYRSKTRYNEQDDYILRPVSQNDTGGASVKPAWTNIYDAKYSALNSSGNSVYNVNNYKAAEKVYAEYLMVRYKGTTWEFGGGLRVENTQTDWSTRVYSPSQPSSGSQTYQDFLPSAFVKYRLTPKADLHASYFRSISRPNYYELVPASHFAGDYIVQGNPGLLHSVADNYDLRLEYFPKGEQHFFAGVFYKKITNPIEQSLINAKNGILTLLPLNNILPAEAYGAEVAFTQYFGKFGVTGNYTYTHSAVTGPKLHIGSTVQETRPLQGQTDHTVNVSLLFKDVRNGFFAQLAYGYQGTTLVQVASYYQSDYYQRPMNTLSFSLEKDIHKHFTVFGKFNNLLNTPAVQYVQKTLEVSRDVYKASYSIGVRYER